MQEQNFEKIKSIFNEVFKCGDLMEVMEVSLLESDINSLNFIKFIVAIEDAFEIEVKDQYLDYNQYSKISQMIQTIENVIVSESTE